MDAQAILDEYGFWRRALAGEKIGSKALPVHENDPQPGFYRRRYKKNEPYAPVAIWRDGDTLICLVDGKEQMADEVWTWCCRYPVSEQQYHDRVQTGRWWDDAAPDGDLVHDTSTNNPPTDPVEILKGRIDAACTNAATYAEIGDDKMAASAQACRSLLLELGGEADKTREAEKKPHLDAGRIIDGKFMPLVKSAQKAADGIRAALRVHENRKLREAEEAARKAQEAIPRPPGPSADVVDAAVPVPVLAIQTTIQGATGRAASIRMVKVAKVTDQDLAYTALKAHKELVELIAHLAQRAANAGVSLPGVEITEEVDVR